MVDVVLFMWLLLEGANAIPSKLPQHLRHTRQRLYRLLPGVLLPNVLVDANVRQSSPFTVPATRCARLNAR